MEVDISYLLGLGPQALPGINKAAKIREGDFSLVGRRDSLVERFQREMASWRAWGLRDWRLKRYLDRQEKRAAG